MKSQTSPGSNPNVRHHSHAKPRRQSGRAQRIAVFTVLPACVSAAAVWALLDAAAPAAPAPAQSSSATVQMVGQVVAVTPESITTRSTDGTTTTFQITPATAQYNSDGGTNSITGSAFSVNETVTVTGVVHNGTTVATALADQNAGGGPPMDAV